MESKNRNGRHLIWWPFQLPGMLLFPAFFSLLVLKCLFFDPMEYCEFSDVIVPGGVLLLAFVLYFGFLLTLLLCTMRRERASYASVCRRVLSTRRLSHFGGEACSSPLKFTNCFLHPPSLRPRDFWDDFFENRGLLLFPVLSVNEALAHAGRINGLADVDARRDALLSLLKLDRVAHRPMRTLSQGDQKKAAVAMELMAGEGHLLLEEPLKLMDNASAKKLQTFLHFLGREQGGRLAVTVKGSLPLLKLSDEDNQEEAQPPLSSRQAITPGEQFEMRYRRLDESSLDEPLSPYQ